MAESCNLSLLDIMVKSAVWDFFDAPVVKNPPAKARNKGSIPDPGKFHMM